MDDLPRSSLVQSAVELLGLVEGRQITFITIIVALFVIALSRFISRITVGLLTNLLVFINVKVPKILLDALRDLVRTVFVVLSLFSILRVISLPDQVNWLSERALSSVVLIHVMATIYRYINHLISEALPRSDIASQGWLVNVARLIIIVVAFAGLSELWGVNISTAVAGMGVFGAGVAIALQDFFKNFVAGLTNRSERRFRRGDWIETTEFEGTLERIDIRSSMVMGFDRVPRYIPNSALADAVLLNKSQIDNRRINWTVPLIMESTDAQIEFVCNELRRHVQQSGDYVTDGSRPCIIVVKGLSDSSVDIMIYVFTKTADWQSWLKICGDLVIALRTTLREAGTALAYPTQTVRIQGDRTILPE